MHKQVPEDVNEDAANVSEGLRRRLTRYGGCALLRGIWRGDLGTHASSCSMSCVCPMAATRAVAPWQDFRMVVALTSDQCNGYYSRQNPAFVAAGTFRIIDFMRLHNAKLTNVLDITFSACHLLGERPAIIVSVPIRLEDLRFVQGWMVVCST